jgi:hypothetical protein
MIFTVRKTLAITVLAFLLAIAASPLTAQVYKVVDKDGNVTFTDQAPADGSKPIKLAPISVIETPVYEVAPKATEDENADKEPTLGNLRKMYRDFAIVTPTQEESVWKPDGPIPVSWHARNPLRQGMEITLFLDGKIHSTTTQPIIALNGLDRGEHTLKAEIRDAKNRTVATADTVTFFVKQPNLNTNPRINRGGG